MSSAIVESLQKMNQAGDVYGLLALSLPALSQTDEQIRDLFVKVLKSQLNKAYITPHIQITAERMDINLLKLIGRDASPFFNARGRLEGSFDQLVGFQVKDDYEGARPFTITSDGAQALCSVIREQRHIEQLIIHSKGESPTLDRKVIEILTQQLPEGRFKYLEIVTKIDAVTEKILEKSWYRLYQDKDSSFVYQDHQGNLISLKGADRLQDHINEPFTFGEDSGDY